MALERGEEAAREEEISTTHECMVILYKLTGRKTMTPPLAAAAAATT
jgi:hypothetical protein